MIGISIRKTVGVGDAVQFTSVPENYFRATGKVLLDTKDWWVFDFNPYVYRDRGNRYGITPEKTVELWQFEHHPCPREEGVFLSNAEHHAALMNVPVVLNRPRLYRYEDFPFHKRETILFQTHGKSHGKMPDHVIDHVLKKYKGGNLFHIGLPSDPDIGIPKIETPDLWSLAKVISESRMLIGMDSGPSWIAACYPDVIVKKLRAYPEAPGFKTWVPLQANNIHSHWDDRMFQIFNPTEDDIGFTWSFKRI